MTKDAEIAIVAIPIGAAFPLHRISIIRASAEKLDISWLAIDDFRTLCGS